MWQIRKEVKLNIGHYLPGHPKCGVEHGHTLKVIVHCEGCKLTDGMLVDYGIIAKKYDHSKLNKFMEIPTVENLAKRICEETPYCTKVEIMESDTSWCSYEY